MIPHQFVKQYKNYDIFLRRPGFESIPNAFGKVASFIVRNEENNTALFAFAYSGMDAIQQSSTNPINEVELLNIAVSEIEKFINSGSIENNQEYTFEYQNNTYNQVSNAAWWVKTSPSPSPEA